FAEAIAAAEKMLAIEREVFGNLHEDVAGSLGYIALMQGEKGDFAAAKKARQEVLAICTKRHGDDHWRVADARRALADVDRLATLTPEQRSRLRQADQLNGSALRLHGQGKVREAIPLAERAVAIRQQVLGEKHPTY